MTIARRLHGLRQRAPRQHLDGHLRFIRDLPCLICGNNIETEAAHVRMADGSIAKPMTGIGTKSHDWFVVPLCGGHHRDQHDTGNEREWWALAEIDPVKIAMALYIETGNHGRGLEIVGAAR